MDRYFAAVFTDLESNSIVWSRTPRDQMVGIIAEYRYLAESLASQFASAYRKFTGDGHLFLFEGADAAARFGLELISAWQATEAGTLARSELPHIPLRVGCHFGECMPLQDGEDWVGRGINLAKRVEDVAASDSLYVTEGVLELLDISVYAIEDAGAHVLKGDHLPQRNLYRVGSFDKAALERRPREELNAEDWFLRGAALCGTERENTEEEGACYREALRLRSDYPEAHNNLAAVLRAQGRHSEAAEHYREALRLRPVYPEAHYNYAILLDATGSTAGAAERYEQAISLRPGYVDAHHAYANFLKVHGDLTAAEEHYLEVLQLRPRYAEALNDYAILLEDRGLGDQARDRYEQALTIRPDFAEARYNLAILLENLGDAAGAERHYREAIRIWPGYAQAHNNLAILLQAQENRDGAEDHLREALALLPNDPETHYNYALLLRAKGDSEGAAEHFGIAHEIAPDVEAFRSAMQH